MIETEGKMIKSGLKLLKQDQKRTKLGLKLLEQTEKDQKDLKSD